MDGGGVMPSTCVFGGRECDFLVARGSDGTERRVSALEWGERDHGDPNASRWLAVHGWLDNAASFGPVAEQLVASDPAMHLVCVDLAGHGRSQHRHDPSYVVVDYVADLKAVVDELGWADAANPFSLMGHSLGGGVAGVFAGTFPGLVRQLVLVEALGPWSQPADEAATSLANALSKRRPLHVAPRPRRTFKSIEEAAQRRSEGNIVGKLPPSAARVLCQRGLLPAAAEVDGAKAVAWSTDPALMLPSRFKQDEVSAPLPRDRRVTVNN